MRTCLILMRELHRYIQTSNISIDNNFNDSGRYVPVLCMYVYLYINNSMYS